MSFRWGLIWPVQAAADGLDRQLLTVAISVVSVVQVVPAHFPASTLGKDVVLLYAPEHFQIYSGSNKRGNRETTSRQSMSRISNT